MGTENKAGWIRRMECGYREWGYGIVGFFHGRKFCISVAIRERFIHKKTTWSPFWKCRYWSSINGCTSFNHSCQRGETGTTDLYSTAGETNPMQAGDMYTRLLHSQTEGTDSEMRCRTWRSQWTPPRSSVIHPSSHTHGMLTLSDH